MKALQYQGPEKLEYVDLPQPVAAENEVVIKMKKVGICGTDLHVYHGGMPDLPCPLVLGHEFTGEVVQVGSKVRSIKAGDRVVAEHVLGCGICYYCKSGQKNVCKNPVVYGLHKPGALSEFMAIPADLVYVLPEEMSYDQGVLVEPISIAVYAVRKSRVSVGDLVCVIGQGPIGLFLDQVLKAAGATVYGVDIMQARLDYALSHGHVNGVINSKDSDPVKELKMISGKEGVDFSFEAVGREQTVQLAIDVVKPGGSVEVLGVFEKPVNINMMSVVRREITVAGSWTCLDSFVPTINLLENKSVKIDGFITHRYDFNDAISAFKDASSYNDNRIKTIIEF